MKILLVCALGLLMAGNAMAREPWCSNADMAGKEVAALGGAAQHPGALFRQGCEAAIFEAQTCAISGSFSDGDQCWVKYGGCRNSAWVTATNSNDVQDFVNALKAQYAATGTCGGGDIGEYYPGQNTVAPPAQNNNAAPAQGQTQGQYQQNQGQDQGQVQQNQGQ